ncbi:hypothetical protein CFOL_v3_01664 [Cephalotus follicularis]|uniref:Uncharacterized protein n=1 Tax=Cephalotus follicularis TaxID=3775 RepID=A0A1Q3AR63_CEPFO|nr:hypothetical protein CFOL_v3_01664 [Cephalotus follicularis]
MVQHEETHRSSMLPSGPPDHSTFVTMSRPSLSVPDSVNNQANEAVRHCDHFNKGNHTRDTCFKLHGRPKGRGGQSSSRGGRFNSRGRSTSQAHFSDQLVLIQSLFLILLQSYLSITSLLFIV